MKTFYIYHIPGVKIGCTGDLEKRMRDQGFTSWEILEEHTDIYEASRREIELQREYGYLVDNTPYYIVATKFINNSSNRGSWSNGDQATRGKVKSVWRHSLTYEQIEEIKSKYIPRKYSQYKLAKEYNVAQSVISNIITNKTYQK